MKHYYITNPSTEKGFVEVSEAEFTAIVGTEETRPYANKVYRGELTIEEVPTELQTNVQAVVDAKITRWGEYNKQEISANEFKNILEEVL